MIMMITSSGRSDAIVVDIFLYSAREVTSRDRDTYLIWTPFEQVSNLKPMPDCAIKAELQNSVWDSGRETDFLILSVGAN